MTSLTCQHIFLNIFKHENFYLSTEQGSFSLSHVSFSVIEIKANLHCQILTPASRVNIVFV